MMRGVPTILHEHANLTDTPWFQKVADKMLAPATDIAIAVSKSTAEFVINARQMPAERVKVVYLGVPLEEFSRTRTIEEVAAARHELGAAPDEFIVGTVTRLHDSKGNSYLVEAARDVLQQRPKTRFYLFGEGPLRPELEAQARALGLGDRFVFGGFTRDVARTVSAFDVSVFPSLWEGTPLTVFEALAMGKPIVATDADGLLDVLTHERDAVIVQKRDAGALARAMMRLIDTPEDRARLSVHARVTGRQYDIAAFVRKMEQLYDLLHEVSRATRRRGVLTADLSFLSDGARV
jgi:glycosyltransferase involved in cell wall biosynthesis